MIRKTADGSDTFISEQFQETYHSVNGALTETMHVFVNAGLECFKDKEELKIFEFGLGTGLNVLAALQWSDKQKVKINYHGVEAFPLTFEKAKQLNYGILLGSNYEKAFELVHLSESQSEILLGDKFSFTKYLKRWEEMNSDLFAEYFDVIFFDAFSPEIQPELWTTEIFTSMYQMMKKKSVLVTYCAKGQVRRNMKSAGFNVERLPGPPGKREMLRALK